MLWTTKFGVCYVVLTCQLLTETAELTCTFSLDSLSLSGSPLSLLLFFRWENWDREAITTLREGQRQRDSRTWVLNHPITLSNQISYPRNKGEANHQLGPDSACFLVPFLACSSCREPWSPGERPPAALFPSWSLHSLQSNFTACVPFNTYKSLGRQVSLPSAYTRWEAQRTVHLAQGWKRIWEQKKLTYVTVYSIKINSVVSKQKKYPVHINWGKRKRDLFFFHHKKSRNNNSNPGIVP